MTEPRGVYRYCGRAQPVADEDVLPAFEVDGSADPFAAYPAGLLGEVAEHLEAAMDRPCPPLALAAALAFVGGIVGSTYGVGTSGLNLYVVGLSDPLTGVSAVPAAQRLASAVSKATPEADGFFGPTIMHRPSDLIAWMKRSPSYVAMVSDLADQFLHMSTAKPLHSMVMARRRLALLFGLSGKGSYLRDAGVHSGDVKSPALSVYGEGSPESWWQASTDRIIAEGLPAKWTVVVYDGARPPLNETPQAPPSKLVAEIGHLAGMCSLLNGRGEHGRPVSVSAEATSYFSDFGRYVDAKVRLAPTNVQPLWADASTKARRIAALAAVGCSITAPEISLAQAKWAVAYTVGEVETACAATVGCVGTELSARENIDTFLRRYLREWQTRSWGAVNATIPHNYKVLHRDKLIPHRYLMRRARGLARFRSKEQDAKGVMREAIDRLIKAGEIRIVHRDRLASLYSMGPVVYETLKLQPDIIVDA